jgi:FkbM family methyltransferase
MNRYIRKIKAIKHTLFSADRASHQTSIEIQKIKYTVPEHWFWKEFNESGWEPKTQALIEKYAGNREIYVDIGAWVGVTLMYANASRVKRIIGAEANPETYELLLDLVKKNARMKDLEIVNRCIYIKDGVKVGFGSTTAKMSSTSSVFRNSQWEVRSIRLITLLREWYALRFNFMKIDIEGAELYIANDLTELYSLGCGPILLALHPTFWPQIDPTLVTQLMAALKPFQIYDPDLNQLSHDEIVSRITSCEEYPPWGTPFGNFFEVLLVSNSN